MRFVSDPGSTIRCSCGRNPAEAAETPCATDVNAEMAVELQETIHFIRANYLK